MYRTSPRGDLARITSATAPANAAAGRSMQTASPANNRIGDPGLSSSGPASTPVCGYHSLFRTSDGSRFPAFVQANRAYTAYITQQAAGTWLLSVVANVGRNVPKQAVANVNSRPQ